MANRYWVGGTATWDSTAGTKWSTTSGGASGAAAPTSADDVFFSAASTGTVTLSATSIARSINCTGFTGTLAHPNLITVNIGDATAGASNVALLLSSGMTYTTAGVASQFQFVSTSATQQTITTNGKILGNMTMNGVGGSWILGDALNWLQGSAVTLQAGTFNTGNFAMSGGQFNFGSTGVRTLTLGSSTIALSANGNNWTGTVATNLTITSNTAVVTITGTVTGQNNLAFLASANWNGLSFSASTANIANWNSQGATIRNLTMIGNANQTDLYRFQGSITITGTLTITGNSAANRIYVFGTVASTSVTAAAVSLTNVDFMDIAGAGAAAPFNGTTLGDRQGNSGIIFTIAATQTRDSTVGNWSTAARWTSRVPLPQDNVIFNSSSANTTVDQLVMGKDISFTGYTGTLTLTSNANAYSFFGSMTLASGMNYGSNPNTFNIEARGRNSHLITTNGKAWFPAGTNANTTIIAPNGNYTLADNLSYSQPTTSLFLVSAGTFNSANLTMNVGRFQSNGTAVRSINLGSSQINLVSIGAVAMLSLTSTGLTPNMINATFTIISASANTRLLSLGGVAIGTFNYTIGASVGQLTVTDPGYVDTFNFSDATNARTLAITSNVTASFNNFNVIGASGRNVTLTGLTSGTPAYLEILSSPAITDYLTVKDIYSVIPNKLYAGTNSTDVSGNTNVIFTSSQVGPYISLRSDAIASNMNTITATFPFGLVPVAGRKIIVGLGGNQAFGSITPPPGFAQVASAGNTPWIALFEKVSDGTETSLTFTTANVVQILTSKVYTLGGFTDLASLDITDTNTATAVTSLNTAGSSPATTASPALAFGFFSANNSMGNSVSATNGFGIIRDSSEISASRVISKLLLSNAPVNAIYSWSTARNATTLLAVYKNVSTVPNTGFLPFFT